MSKPELLDLIASAIANARAMRRGAPAITNVLDILPQNLKDQVRDDARAVYDALNDQGLIDESEATL